MYKEVSCGKQLSHKLRGVCRGHFHD